MSAFNLPPGCTLDMIDDLFKDDDEDQCQDAETQGNTDIEDLTIAQMDALAQEQAILEYEASQREAKKILDEPLPF